MSNEDESKKVENSDPTPEEMFNVFKAILEEHGADLDRGIDNMAAKAAICLVQDVQAKAVHRMVHLMNLMLNTGDFDSIKQVFRSVSAMRNALHEIQVVTGCHEGADSRFWTFVGGDKLEKFFSPEGDEHDLDEPWDDDVPSKNDFSPEAFESSKDPDSNDSSDNDANGGNDGGEG